MGKFNKEKCLEAIEDFYSRERTEEEKQRAAQYENRMSTNCLSFWYPTLQKLEIKTPETIIIKTDVYLTTWPYDGVEPEGLDCLVEPLKKAAEKIGIPVFLRTGQTSGKHYWKDTCYLDNLDRENIVKHIYSLVEFSAIADMRGLDTNVWVVREMLETEPAFHAFQQMPITKEFRYFVKDGKIVHKQPYWPEKAIEGYCTEKDWKKKLKDMSMLDPETDDHLSRESIAIGLGIGGCWSIDWILTKKGWYCTDMALGDNSYIYNPPEWFLKK